MGLIGGSVALALKKAQTKPGSMHIIGLGRNPASLASALQLGVIDQGLDIDQADLQASLADADLILIAAPVAQTSGILALIKPHLNPRTVITDAGSTKSDVLACAQTILAEQFNQFVGGHPIAGAEKSGVTAARASLSSPCTVGGVLVASRLRNSTAFRYNSVCISMLAATRSMRNTKPPSSTATSHHGACVTNICHCT